MTPGTSANLKKKKREKNQDVAKVQSKSRSELTEVLCLATDTCPIAAVIDSRPVFPNHYVPRHIGVP